jgi:polysaccharide biosynthesis transport protein
MTLAQTIRIAQKNLPQMVLAGLILATIMYFRVKNTKHVYTTTASVNSGLTTGNQLSGQGGRVDYHMTNIELEKLMTLATSNELANEVFVLLVADYIKLEAPSKKYVLPENWHLVKTMLPSAFITDTQKITDLDSLRTYIRSLNNQIESNPIKVLRNSEHPLFSLAQIKKMLVSRQKTSDVIEFGYEMIDPGVCYNTMNYYTSQFIRSTLLGKETQSKDVLNFFEKSLNESAQNLRQKEEDLLMFSVKNNIINYYEQSRFLAEQKEVLENDFFKERMSKASADSSIVRLERELASRLNIPTINQLLVSQRSELALINSSIARKEVLGTNAKTEGLPVAELQSRADGLKSQIKEQASNLLITKTTHEGVETKKLLEQWLEKVLAQEEAEARLKVFHQRKNEFNHNYARYAPWGSQLKRNEREIDVAERAYLENLNSYNEAMLRQFNMMLSGGMGVIDQPIFPDQPKPQQRKLLVIVAFIIGLLLVFAVAMFLEIFDKTLKAPNRAAREIQLPLAGAFPLLPHGLGMVRGYDYSKMLSQAMFQMFLHLKGVTGDIAEPIKVGIISLAKGEGKSTIEDALQMQAVIMGHPEDFQFKSHPALLEETSIRAWNTDSDFFLLVVRANRNWSSSDRAALERFKTMNPKPIHLVLNAVSSDNMDELLGGYTKRRSLLRRIIKKYLAKIGVK